jgi:hypothetical protein
MTESSNPKRREFLGRLAAGAVAIGLGGTVPRALAAEHITRADIKPDDKWLSSLKGKHRQFFDMPKHDNGMGLIHVRNYLNTLRDTYGVKHPDVTAVTGLYGMSTPLAFNDTMWQKYGLANPIKVMDASKSPATSNVFYKAPEGAANLSVSGAPIGIPADSSISALQQRGGVFLLCNNAFNVWMGILGGGDAAKAAGLRTEFEANMLPGIFLVPAMVVAVNQAQTNGCSYMYL